LDFELASNSVKQFNSFAPYGRKMVANVPWDGRMIQSIAYVLKIDPAVRVYVDIAAVDQTGNHQTKLAESRTFDNPNDCTDRVERLYPVPAGTSAIVVYVDNLEPTAPSFYLGFQIKTITYANTDGVERLRSAWRLDSRLCANNLCTESAKSNLTCANSISDIASTANSFVALNFFATNERSLVANLSSDGRLIKSIAFLAKYEPGSRFMMPFYAIDQYGERTLLQIVYSGENSCADTVVAITNFPTDARAIRVEIILLSSSATASVFSVGFQIKSITYAYSDGLNRIQNEWRPNQRVCAGGYCTESSKSDLKCANSFSTFTPELNAASKTLTTTNYGQIISNLSTGGLNIKSIAYMVKIYPVLNAHTYLNFWVSTIGGKTKMVGDVEVRPCKEGLIYLNLSPGDTAIEAYISWDTHAIDTSQVDVAFQLKSITYVDPTPIKLGWGIWSNWKSLVF
jgi:hypothetical protein